MRKEREDQLDPSQPALIVTYGSTPRKHRPLDRDLVVIGRSTCCDIGLVSPEVAPIHCVIVKSADGWHIRDCTGRGGTRVNGKSVQDELLNDCDALQIGTFSFQVNLPREAPPAAPVAPSQVADNKADEAQLLHLKQSRERLARHALNLRRRLHDQNAAQPTAAVAPSQFDADLGAQRAELEQREKKLRFWEKELTELDRNLREEYAEVERDRKELQRFSQETLLRKQVELEQKVEAILAEQRADLEAQAERTLAQRRAELDQFADSLQLREHDLELERRQLEEKMLQILAEQQAQLSAHEESLQEKQRDLEEQLQQVETINAELAETREALRLEFEDADRLRAEAQLELETQVQEAEAYVEALWQQGEAHRRRLEANHGPVVALPDLATQTRAVEIRRSELDAYARHLQRTWVTLTGYEQELSEAYQQFHAEYDSAVRDAQALNEAAVEQADAQRCRGVSKGHSGDTERLVDTAHGLPAPNTSTAARHDEPRPESERLRAELTAQLGAERNRVEKAEAQANCLKSELTELRTELQHRDEVLELLQAELQQRGEPFRRKSDSGVVRQGAPERLLAQVEQLKKDIGERDERIHELQRSVAHLQQLSGHREKQAYEAELNQYRVELEQDRVLVNDEIARLQVFRAEVEEARQEMELHISRERLQIAREWAELNRVREQLRRETAKLEQPDSALRERATKAKQPKTEAAVEVTPSAPPSPPTSQDLIARLRPANKHGRGLPS